VLLCRHHHLLFHNNGWEIRRTDGGEYWLIPPPTVDPQQSPIRLESKSGAMRDLAVQRESREPVRVG
jgi:hypothetical protein